MSSPPTRGGPSRLVHSLSEAETCSLRNVKCAGSRKNEVWLTVLRSISNWAPQPLGSFLRTCSWNWQKLEKPLT